MIAKEDKSLFSSSFSRIRKPREVFMGDMYTITDRGINSSFKPLSIDQSYDQTILRTREEDRPSMKALYFKWLIDKLDKQKIKRYSSLIMHLFKATFVEHESVPMDVNRARDGVALRKHFISSNPCYGDSELESIQYDDCSWLEMIIALAEKIDDQMMFDMNMGNRTDKWFWLIISQMGLDKYDENHYVYLEVRDILRNLELRKYKNDGKDGIFKCNKNVTKVEIWYQMMEFFNENSPKIEF